MTLKKLIPCGAHGARCALLGLGLDGAFADAQRSGTSTAAAAAARAPAWPRQPPSQSVDSGDTAWMLTSTALVLLMTIPGLALFYGGMVRKKNVLATVMQSFAITCLVTVLWMVDRLLAGLHRRRQPISAASTASC